MKKVNFLLPNYKNSPLDKRINSSHHLLASISYHALGVLMGKEENDTNLALAGLKFSKSGISSACNNEKNTQLALILIIFSILLDVVIAFFMGNGGSSGLGRMGLIGFEAAIAESGSVVFGTFLSAFIMVYVIRIFKVKPTYSGILRVYGAAIIWTIIKSLLGLVLPPNFALLGIVFWLAYNVSVLIGLAGYTKIKIWQSFLSIVITFALIFGVMMAYGIIITLAFG